ncbi:Unknown protein [Striga hermonthica]|uniref:Organ specific protein n=1 Tax=Striga hermonthica TaxID=68872 RepID=A0A9N7REQ0_STRHE|nr:Unknown protein [Striga hermonthica]
MGTRAITVFFILSLVLVGKVTSARKGPGEYWKKVMNGEPMPEAIANLLRQSPSAELNSKSTTRFIRNFDTRPNVIIYHSHHHNHPQRSAPKDG